MGTNHLSNVTGVEKPWYSEKNVSQRHFVHLKSQKKLTPVPFCPPHIPEKPTPAQLCPPKIPEKRVLAPLCPPQILEKRVPTPLCHLKSQKNVS